MPPLPLYKQAGADIEQRIEDLLSRMTPEEKAAQLIASQGKVFDNEEAFAPDTDDSENPYAALRNGIGHISRMGEDSGPANTAKTVNATQRFLVEQTRLGIPAIIHEECLHGLMQDGATIFPQSIAMASSWDPDLIEEVFSAIALETRSRGCNQALTPNLDIIRDPRFGRTEESYGEDPYLVSRFAVAMVRGFQGQGPIITKNKLVATGKHFAAAGEPLGGLNCGAFHGGERMVREICLPSFEAAVKEAGLLSIMAAYNEIDGIPCHLNKWLLTDVLRGEWGFDGVVVSDYGALIMVQQQHSVAEDAIDATSQGLNAGMDIELPGARVYKYIPEALERGTLTPEVVDESVRRVLLQKFRVGLFEQPFADEDEAARINNCDAHKRLARKTAERSIVLLKNENNALPLDASALKRVAVIGPNAARCIHGSYTVASTVGRGVSILDGVRDYLGDSAVVDYAEGCKIHLGNGYWREPEAVLNDPQDDRRLIGEAVSVAEGADVAIVVVGGDGQTCRESFEPRIGDRNDLSLMGLQDELVKAVHTTGTPTVVVLINGRPLAINDIAEQIDAVVEGWYLGEETGHAMANVLFGAVNPGGKLPFSFPRSVGHLPCYYNKTKMSLARRYINQPNTPLFCFGHGLSYTTFEISEPTVSPSVIAKDETATVTVSVSNTGNRSGDEVVQLYIRDCFSSVIRPGKELKGFQRIQLEPGQTKQVSFSLGFDSLALYNREMKRVVEPGEFTLMVGSCSDVLKSCTLTVQ